MIIKSRSVGSAFFVFFFGSRQKKGGFSTLFLSRD